MYKFVLIIEKAFGIVLLTTGTSGAQQYGTFEVRSTHIFQLYVGMTKAPYNRCDDVTSHLDLVWWRFTWLLISQRLRASPQNPPRDRISESTSNSKSNAEESNQDAAEDQLSEPEKKLQLTSNTTKISRGGTDSDDTEEESTQAVEDSVGLQRKQKSGTKNAPSL